MSGDGSVTILLHQLREQGGCDAAYRPLWERYCRRLVGLARSRLAKAGLQGAAEEGALRAFDSFVRGAADDRFPRLDGRGNLWALLLKITFRKAARQVEQKAKRKE